MIKHARYYWLLLAESHLTRRVFGSMVRRIAALPLPTGYARRRASRQGEGTGGEEVYEKSLEIRHFRVFAYPEEAELAPSWDAAVARDGKG